MWHGLVWAGFATMAVLKDAPSRYLVCLSQHDFGKPLVSQPPSETQGFWVHLCFSHTLGCHRVRPTEMEPQLPSGSDHYLCPSSSPWFTYCQGPGHMGLKTPKALEAANITKCPAFHGSPGCPTFAPAPSNAPGKAEEGGPGGCDPSISPQLWLLK